MSILAAQIEQTLLPGMVLPQPLVQLFSWIEANGLFIERPTGERIGFLYPECDRGKPGVTEIEFAAEGNVNLKYWFGHERSDVLDKLCVFAQTGAEGSMAAFWLNPQGVQKIVHLGSGSGSTMVCVLAEDPIDFLRLLAIGYDEICWGREFHQPPANLAGGDRNQNYRNWVSQTFGVTIPKLGIEIVNHPDDMDTKNSTDEFNQWVSRIA